LGLVLGPPAATMAAMHLRVSGVTATSVTLVVAALVGLAALAVGVLRLWAGRRAWTRLALVVGLLVVGYTLVVPWCVANAATTAPRPAVDDDAAARVGLDVTEVTFAAADGTRLSGWFAPSTGGPVVILLHGASSTRADVMPEAAVLAEAGYAVFAFDARGHGRSDGRAMELGWGGDADVSSAIDVLVDRFGADPGRVALYGASMGGEVALGAAARDERIAAVVSEGATGRTVDDHGWLADACGWRGSAQQAVDHVTYGFVDVLSPGRPPPSLRHDVAVTRCPVLLVTAGAVEDEGRAARWIAGGAPGNVEVWDVPGAGHTRGLEEAPEDWDRRVVGFLDAALGD